jgi:SNF2 family DNA or RNA helicase
LGEREKRPASLSRVIAEAAPSSSPAPQPQLRPYQQEGADLLTSRGRFNLFDEVGLGKTPQTLVALRQLGAEEIVVVCRAFSKGVWRREPSVWFPELEVFDCSGTPHQKEAVHASFRQPKETGRPRRPRLLVTTYADLRNLRDRKWQALVFDEAHALSNRRRRSQDPGPFERAQLLRSRWLFNLTGTPTRKHLQELWNYLNLIDPKEFSSFWRFIDTYFFTADGRFGKEILQPKQADPLRDLFKEYSLRRMKRQVEPEMPHLTRQKLVVDLTPAQRSLYQTIAEEMMVQRPDGSWVLVPNAAVKSLRLRQLIVSPRSLGLDCGSESINAAAEKAEELLANGRSVLISSPFKDCVMDLAAAMKGLAPQWVVTGDQPEKNNDRAIQAFQAHPDPALLFCTIQMAGSWTATKACDAIACGYDWSPIINYQFEGRIDRFGQRRAMTIYYVTGRNTIDEAIIGVLDEKIRWADFVMNPRDLLFPKVD